MSSPWSRSAERRGVQGLQKGAKGETAGAHGVCHGGQGDEDALEGAALTEAVEGLMGAELLKEDHRQEAGPDPSAGNDVEGRVLKDVVAIDGKALRGAYERGRKATPLHLVNVWAAEARLVIGQRLAPGRNEVLGIQQALALLRLDGCIVTAAALHCLGSTPLRRSSTLDPTTPSP